MLSCQNFDLVKCGLVLTYEINILWCHADNFKRWMSPHPHRRFPRVSINNNVFFTRSRADTCCFTYWCLSPHPTHPFLSSSSGRVRCCWTIRSVWSRALLHQRSHLLDIHTALYSCCRLCTWLQDHVFFHKSLAQLVFWCFNIKATILSSLSPHSTLVVIFLHNHCSNVFSKNHQLIVDPATKLPRDHFSNTFTVLYALSMLENLKHYSFA